jgi:phenylacetate-CoA ligase
MSAALAFVDRLKRHVVGESLVRRNPFYYERSRRLLDRIESEGLEQRRAWNREQLARTLSLARGTDYGASVRGGNDINSWPLLDKELLRNRLHAFTTGTEWLSASANTGGTSGVPLKLVRSLEGIVFEQACLDRMMNLVGVQPRSVRTALLRGDNLTDPRVLESADGISADGGRQRIYCARSVSPHNVDRLVDSLEKFAPQLLCAYPSALENLCRLLQERGRTLKVPSVTTSSEVLKPAAWGMAKETLGCRLVDYYGQAERVAFAFASAPREYRFLPGYSYVEFAPHNAKVLPGDSDLRLYEIIGTTYWNTLMPLVRYRTGDLILLPAAWGKLELEELALGLRTFRGVLGREQEIMVCPQPVRLTGLDTIPSEVDHVLRIQVVQETLDSARIVVVPASGFGADDSAKLLANVRARVPGDVHLTVEIATWLERTPRGKTPLMLHRPPVHEALRRAGVEPATTH